MARNPTSRRPSESTQEALNSLLAMCSSDFEPYSTISTKIPPRGTDAGLSFNPLWASGTIGKCVGLGPYLVLDPADIMLAADADIPPDPKGAIGPKGVKWGVPPRGYFGQIVEDRSKQPNQCVKRLFRAS